MLQSRQYLIKPRLFLGELWTQHQRVSGTAVHPGCVTAFPNIVRQFFITTAKCDFLDGKHVVFGKVIDGMLTLRKIENVPTGPNNRPKLVVKITGAFLLSLDPRQRLISPVECGEM